MIAGFYSSARSSLAYGRKGEEYKEEAEATVNIYSTGDSLQRFDYLPHHRSIETPHLHHSHSGRRCRQGVRGVLEESVLDVTHHCGFWIIKVRITLQCTAG